jgi:S-adenosylmethionine:tRNA ribosyltransferase-isomerase
MPDVIRTAGPVRPADYEYALPAELIAQTPAPVRDAARLLVLDRASGALRHSTVRALPELLRAGDLLVFNDARVQSARLFCRSAGGAAIELLLVREDVPGVWLALGRPAKRLRDGAAIVLPDGGVAAVRGRRAPGMYAIELPAGTDVAALLARYGELPLPPYIRRPQGLLAIDRDRYQTVFASRDGAVAAPTAGLHFTPALLDALAAAGVWRAALSLIVGPGTFLPVRSDDARQHQLDPEWAELPAETTAAIAAARVRGGRIIAVGTTTARALESAAAGPRGLAAGGFWADAFILPPFAFRAVDALLTNFHLPRSTLLMLVAAFAGRERVLAAYAEAIRAGYRFYSYGDAMLIV